MSFPKSIIAQLKYLTDFHSGHMTIMDKLVTRGWGRLYNRVVESPCKRFIFKYSYICDDWDAECGLTAIPEHAVPTRFIKVCDGCSNHFILQKRADTKRANDAFEFLKPKLKAAGLYDFIDLHHGNVGHYRGRAVLIDW